MKLTHSRAVLIMIAVTLMWSIAGVVTRHLEQAQSFEVTFWRSLFTLISLLIILPIVQGREVFTRIRQARGPLWISGVCWSVMFTAFMVALTLTSVANVLVTMAVGPLMTALLARIFIGHKIALRTWLAIVAAGVGIGWMFGSHLILGGAAHVSEDGSHVLGTAVGLLVPLAGAINWTVVQRSQAHGEKVDLIPAVLVGAFISSLVTLPLAFPFAASLHDIGLLAFLGLVQLAIPCVLSVHCATVLKAPEIALLALLEVIFGILLAWVGANEVPGASVLTGGSLVIGALLLNELVGWRQRA